MKIPFLIADCVIETSGDIRVRVAPEAGMPVHSMFLSAKEDSDVQGGNVVRLPLTSDGAVLRRTYGRLTEGRWNLFAEYPGASGMIQRRLRAGVQDLRRLLDPLCPRPALPLVSWIPYRTADGWLAIRSWERSGHAEASDIEVDGDDITVGGWLLGPSPAAGPELELELRSRVDPARTITAVAKPAPAPYPAWEGTGQGFRCTFPAGDLALGKAPGDELWDVYARPGDGREPVRVARLLDDIADKKEVCTYPSTEVRATARGPVRVRPFYTRDNALSVRVADMAP